MSAASARWMSLVAKLPCVICGARPVQIHHIAEGSGKRNDFSVAALCEPHHDPHRTGSGFHGMGTERFCKLFRVPGESEYGLLVLTNQALEKLLWETGQRIAA